MFDDSGWLKHVESGLTSSHLAGSWGGKCCFQLAWHHCCHLAALQGCMGKMHWFLIKIPSPSYGLWKDVFLNAETSSKMIENDARWWYIFKVSSSHVFYHFAGSAMVFRGMTRRGSIVAARFALLHFLMENSSESRTVSPLAIPKPETDDFVVATNDHPKMFLL